MERQQHKGRGLLRSVLRTKRWFAAAGMSLALITGSFLFAAPAMADTWIRTSDDNPGGDLMFKAYGDIVEICDLQADGFYVDGRVYYGSKLIYVIQAHGNDTCTMARASQGGSHDLVEGREYRIVVCLDNADGGLRFCRSINQTA
ncbi:hypothetical protein [Micromonospora sp. NPDC005413]|uniref:hypothetical protein n=1 Tax=Micromonospora sp. NPDC005413 TaxID=3154563 RepID=UPI00339F309F